MVAPRTLTRPNLLLPKCQHRSSTSSLSSTHSRRSIIKQTAPVVVRPVRRVRFSDAMELSVSEFSDSSESCADINVDVLEYDPCIDSNNVSHLFFTQEEITNIRVEARRQANRFASDFPDYAETLEQVYDKGAIDLSAVKKPLRNRRKRKHTVNIALQWSILDDDNDDVEKDDEYSFDEDPIEADPEQVDYYANDEENDTVDETYYHANMRGLEVRVTPTFRQHRKKAIQAILNLQREMKAAGCNSAQIEMGLRVKAVQFANLTRVFAINQARLDRMELSC